MVEDTGSVSPIDESQRRGGNREDCLVLENSGKIGIPCDPLTLSSGEMYVDETRRRIVDCATGNNRTLKDGMSTFADETRCCETYFVAVRTAHPPWWHKTSWN